MFGNIFHRKKLLMHRLENIARQMAIIVTLNLEKAHDKVWKEYEEVLRQEEILWFQKSRENWIMYGDRNTKYFYVITKIRRRRNMVETLCDYNDNWIFDPIQLERLVTSYFVKHFTHADSHVNYYGKGDFPKLSR